MFCSCSHCLTFALMSSLVWKNKILRCFFILGNKQKSDGVKNQACKEDEGCPSAKCSGGSQWIFMGEKTFCPGSVNFRWHFFLCPFFQYRFQCSVDAGKGVLCALVNTLAT